MKSRTPQGVRGLKLIDLAVASNNIRSHSARSAWIETGMQVLTKSAEESHSARSAWIETF